MTIAERGSAMKGVVSVENGRTPAMYATAVFALGVATIAGVFAFQAAGYAPCELCLMERLPYYVAMAVAALTIPFALWAPRAATRGCFFLLALIFLFSAGFGAYHAGVEWGFWAGPSDCTGSLTRATNNADFLRQLQTIKVVRCDAVAIRILGLSLAGWNVVVSLVIAAVAVAGWHAARVMRAEPLG